jgi:hypothetical protein
MLSIREPCQRKQLTRPEVGEMIDRVKDVSETRRRWEEVGASLVV